MSRSWCPIALAVILFWSVFLLQLRPSTASSIPHDHIVAHQANILNATGYFEGEWRATNQSDVQHREWGGLSQDSGSVEVSLQTRRSVNSSLLFVYGVMLLRDGVYDSLRNTRYWVDGVQTLQPDTASAEVMLRATPISVRLPRPQFHPLRSPNETDLIAFATAFEEQQPLQSFFNTSEFFPPLLHAFDRLVPSSSNCTMRLRLHLAFNGLRPDSGANSNTGSPASPAAAAVAADPTTAATDTLAAADLSDVTPEQALRSRAAVHVTGTMYSVECAAGLQLVLRRFDEDAHVTRMALYAVPSFLAVLAQLVATMWQMDSTDTQSRLSRVSLITVNMQAVMDSVMVLFHLVNAVAFEPTRRMFYALAFAQFALCCLFEIRYVLLLTQPLRLGDADATRSYLASLACRLYGLHIIVFFLMMSVSSTAPLLVLYAYWLPQIVHNFRTGTAAGLLPSYVWILTLTRLWPVLYFKLWPANGFRMEPSPVGVLVLVLFSLGQAAVLTMQRRWGPDCLIPAALRPAKFDYHRASRAVAQGPDCVICMSQVTADTAAADYMVTPCEHVYHTECLRQWMAVKMECPACRRPLVPE